MTVPTAVFAAGFEIVLVAIAVSAWRTARSERRDRRPSTTLEHVGVAALFTALAIALPVVLALPAAWPLRSTFSLAILLLMVAGVGGLMAKKPLEWWEARSTAKLQAAAGIPTARPLVPPWAVVIADIALTAVVIVVIFLALSWVAADRHWSVAQLVATSTAAASSVVLLGAVGTAGHWWWQRRRVRRAAITHRARNDGYLA